MSTPKAHRLTLPSVRAALRVVGECRDLGYDPGLWRRHAAEGVAALLGVRVVTATECRWQRPDGRITPIDFHQVGLTLQEHDRYFVPFFRSGPKDDDVLFDPLRTAK